MKKQIFIFLTVLLLCFAAQYAYGESPQGIVWGPENQGLRMNLYIVEADSNQPDVYKVRICLTNCGKTPVVLAAQWHEEEEKGDYNEFLKKHIELTSFPEAPQVTAQTAMRSRRTSPQPTLEIKPGDTAAAEWVSERRCLKPNGYYNTAPRFVSNGLYSIRAKFLATTKEGGRILLYSNDFQLVVGKSTAMPKFSIARINRADAAKEIVELNLGSDQKIEAGDKFKCIFFPFAVWEITVTETKDTWSAGSVKTILRDPQENVPEFPRAGDRAELLSSH